MDNMDRIHFQLLTTKTGSLQPWSFGWNNVIVELSQFEMARTSDHKQWSPGAESTLKFTGGVLGHKHLNEGSNVYWKLYGISPFIVDIYNSGIERYLLIKL